MNGCAFVFVTLNGWMVLRVVVRWCFWCCCCYYYYSTRGHGQHSERLCMPHNQATLLHRRWTRVSQPATLVCAYSFLAACCYFNLIWESVGYADWCLCAPINLYIEIISWYGERVDQNASRFSLAHTHSTKTKHKVIIPYFFLGSTTNIK